MKNKCERPRGQMRWNFREHMKKTDPKHWVTYDGRRIAVKDMEDTHVVNAVKLLRRHAPRAKLVECLLMLAGPRPSGDGATLAFESGLEELGGMSDDAFLLEYVPPFRAMLARLRACEESIYERETRELDEAVNDPWGNS